MRNVQKIFFKYFNTNYVVMHPVLVMPGELAENNRTAIGGIRLSV